MIDEYEEIIPAVALKQLNLNVNPRSTIMSYFGLFSYVAYLIHKATGNRLNDFSANGRYKCNTCGGLGYTKRVDEELVIDINASIEEVPFKCWRNTNKDYFKQLLQLSVDEVIETKLVSGKGLKMLNLLSRLGMGHLVLNQELATLSEGENQRIKLAVNLNNNTTRIFGLDEPTRGLGSGDAEKMMGLLYDKVKEDNKTFIIVEHNKSAF